MKLYDASLRKHLNTLKEQEFSWFDFPSILLSPLDIVRFCKDILGGIDHLHSLKIAHRDLKVEKFLILMVDKKCLFF
jgi:serine/threonine protein kinase